METLKFCYTKSFNIAKSVEGRVRAVAYKNKYWNKDHTLKIFFIGGSSYQISNMKDVIDEIVSPLSLKVKYVTTANESEIRISFMYGYGSYSYLGTDCLFIPKNEETLNIGWDGKDVMRHEFCHALNLSHEHQNPLGGIEWNVDKVISDLKGPPNNWSIEQIYYNVINKPDIEKVDATTFDPKSIMLYYFPSSWTLNNFQTNDNPVLSETDKAFLLSKYTIEVADTIAPVINIIGDEYITLKYGEKYIDKGATAIDNKDGDITSKIKTEGTVNSLSPGLQYIIYSVVDAAGNKSQATRTILVEKEVKEERPGCLLGFLKGLFPSRTRLGKLTEDQLLFIAAELGIQAKKEDYKKDTLDKVWNKINVKVL